MNKYLSDKFKVVSFMAMILVVFLHGFNLAVRLKSGQTAVIDRSYNFFIQEFISQGIARTAVPLFFTISGFLFFLNTSGKLEEFKEKYRKRVKTLVIPFFFWSFWSLLLCFLFQQLPPPRIFFANQLVTSYSVEKLLSTIFLHPIAYQLWFIRDLVILVFLSPLLFWLTKNLKFLLLLLLAGFWISNFNLLIVANEALLFFAFGAYLSIFKSELLQIQLSRKQSFVLVLMWFCLIWAKMGLIYFNYPTSIYITILHKLGILMGMLAIWSVYDSLIYSKSEIILKWAPFSFFIYAFHEPILIILKPALFTLLGKGELNSLVVYIFAPLLSILLGIFVAAKLQKVSPKFYSLITGGR